MTAPLFTVSIPDDVGFTDQLMQLALLYRVGAAAGMNFRLLPLASRRSPPGFWERFDPGRVFTRATGEERGLPRHRIDLSAERLLREGVTGGADLVALVKAQLPGPETVAVLKLEGESRPILARAIAADPGD